MVPDSIYDSLAVDLRAEPAAIKAVAMVESSGSGFLPDRAVTPRGLSAGGFPVVQFEGHVFYRTLRNAKAILSDPATALIQDETGKAIGPLLKDILYPSLDMAKMKGPLAEWDQLSAARAISRQEADMSASWGAFQIMGFNWKSCGAKALGEFLEDMSTPEGQVSLFAGFLRSQTAILKALRAKDWRTFARLYNGAKALKNGYDKKIAAAYRRAR